MALTRKERLLKAMLEDNLSACTSGMTREEKMLAGVAKKTCENDALEGGGGGGVSVDPTLTKEGKAADAKATGEALASLNEEIAKKRKEKPLVYIDGVIPTTKDNVLATMTVKSKWLNIFAYIKIKCQGNSGMSYPKKNFTVTLYQDEARSIPLYITIPGWKHPSNKFVFKANYIDHLHARNIISARLWSEVVASRPDYDSLPEELRNSPNNGAVDGFPIIVYTNGSYQGVYTWNIGKDAWQWGMDEDNPNHVLLCAETNDNGNPAYVDNPCNFRALWSGVNEQNWSVEVGTNSDAVKNSLNALITCVKDTTDEEFRAQIGEYLDVQSAIDYYIFAFANCGIDNLAKNMLIGTFDLKKWIVGAYDLDSTWGLYWDGSRFISATTDCPGGYLNKHSLLWEKILRVFEPEIIARKKILRDTVLSYANIVSHFERFAAEIGAESYADDLVPYPNIPSAETNNIWQIRNFVRDRLVLFDSWMTGGVLYELSAPRVIEGVDDVIDTGIKLFEEDKSFTIAFDITPSQDETDNNEVLAAFASDPLLFFHQNKNMTMARWQNYYTDGTPADNINAYIDIRNGGRRVLVIRHLVGSNTINIVSHDGTTKNSVDGQIKTNMFGDFNQGFVIGTSAGFYDARNTYSSDEVWHGTIHRCIAHEKYLSNSEIDAFIAGMAD